MAEFLAEAAPNTPYFTPAQVPPAGTAAPTKDGKPIPSLFQPLKIRGVEFQNRLFVCTLRVESVAVLTTFTGSAYGPLLWKQRQHGHPIPHRGRCVTLAF